MKHLILIILAPLIFIGCAPQGGPAGGAQSKALFSVWTLASDGTTQLDLDGRRPGWVNQFVDPAQPNCTYEWRIEAVAGNDNSITERLYDVTTPADPTCPWLNSSIPLNGMDIQCTVYGSRLECCLINADPNDPSTCYDYN